MEENIVQLRQERRRLVAELVQCEDLVVGSFFERKVNGVPRLCLARMRGRRQRQSYVAARHREEVRRAVRQYRRALQVLQALGEVNFQIIKQQERPPNG